MPSAALCSLRPSQQLQLPRVRAVITSSRVVVVPCEELYVEVLEEEAPHSTELRQVAVAALLLSTIVALVPLLHRWMVRLTLTASSARAADLSPEVVATLVQVLAENSGSRLDSSQRACHRKGQSYNSSNLPHEQTTTRRSCCTKTKAAADTSKQARRRMLIHNEYCIRERPLLTVVPFGIND
jgi:hypothetical protein